jgi:hypothetical protein
MGAPINIVPRLDESRSYIFCPTCEQYGNEGIEMRKDGHRFVCPLNHELDIHTVQKMIKAGRKLHMVPTVVVEQPSPNMVKHQFWIHPDTLELLQQKFKGRFIVTFDTVFNMLCDDHLIFINGEDAEKLNKMGLRTGKDVLAMAEGQKELEETHRALIERLTPIFNAAQSAASGD